MSQPTTRPPYNPQDHLVKVKTKDGMKDYYPFNWRLQEFRTSYPDGILTAEILTMDIERDLVVIKVTAAGDGLGNCAGVGLHQGNLTQIHQVTERAKAQALMDLGIGCAWPVAFDHTEIIEVATLSDATSAQPDEQTSASDHHEEPAQQESGLQHYPERTTESVMALYAKVYRVGSQELEEKFAKFVLGVTGRPLAQGPLTEDELNKLNSVISQRYMQQKSKQILNGTTARKAS